MCIHVCHHRLFDYPRATLLDSSNHDSVLVGCSYSLLIRFMLPTFMNIFIIYSFCNVHDVTWGTRDSNLINNEAAQHNMEVSYVFLLFVSIDTSDFDPNSSSSGLLRTSSMRVGFSWYGLGVGANEFNSVAVYGVILTIIIGILFGYRFVGSIMYQVVKLCKYFQSTTRRAVEDGCSKHWLQILLIKRRNSKCV